MADMQMRRLIEHSETMVQIRRCRYPLPYHGPIIREAASVVESVKRMSIKFCSIHNNILRNE